MADPQKLVVLDRDGVINEDSPDYIKSEAEWRPVPGSLEAIARLHQAGFTLVVATNQSGLARGLFDDIALARIHQTLMAEVEAGGGRLAGIFYCPHAPDAGCACRKPGTGLLQTIEDELAVSLAGCPFVGDSLKDLQAATTWGMRPILVRSGKGRQTEAILASHGFADVPVFDDLLATTEQLLLT
ncbi:MAG: D-glycero-beta-D-manno-heptose 1,7-bisphosphate 7-phosphatase [Pseudohongiellaceae bacterium]